MIEQRYVLTIATGKKVYIDMAVNLARSFLWWHPANTGIVFQLVTDQPGSIPADVKPCIQIISVQAGELGEGFSSKLFLNQLASPGQTLFIDSDCLIFGTLERVFDIFKGHAVSVIGGYIHDGEWFGDIRKVCQKFNVPHIPKFNGGIYYLEKGTQADAIYQQARELEKNYDEIGFVRLRNKPNDELIMALSMQLNGQKPVIDDGTVLSDPQACPGGYSIDVISGKRWLINPPTPHPLHQSWYPFQRVSPLVVHFLGYYTQHYPYKREVFRLKKAMTHRLNWFSHIQGLLTIEYPGRIKNALKHLFRPLYHSFFGIRQVKRSSRI